MILNRNSSLRVAIELFGFMLPSYAGLVSRIELPGSLRLLVAHGYL